jgi:hypothetical protein
MKAHVQGGPLLLVAGVVAAATTTACTQQVLDPNYRLDPIARPATDAGASSAALDGSLQQDGGGDPTLAMLADAGYASSSLFTHVSRAPYPSAAVAGSFIDVWVTSEAYAAYGAITPDGGPVDASLPPGAVIVRVVSDGNGNVSKLTVMRHGPAGVDPSLDDWWFAETDPLGVPLTDDGGELEGALSACTSCHLGRSGEDYLFGVPLSAR